MTVSSRHPTVLLLASSEHNKRAFLLAKEMAMSWQVARLDSRLPAGNIAAAAGRAEIILHLDMHAAEVLASASKPQVFAPGDAVLCRENAPEAFNSAFETLARLMARARLVVMPDRPGSDIARLMFGIPPERLRFGPDAIVGDVLSLAMSPAIESSIEPILLAFNDYPVHGANSGGAMRAGGTLKTFGKPAVLVVLGREGGAVSLAPDLVQVTVPPTAQQVADEADSRKLTGHGLEDILASAHALQNIALIGIARFLATRAGCAVFAHCYLAPLIETLHTINPHLAIVYDCHNVEGELKAEMLAGHPAAETLIAYVREIEQRLVKAASLVLCCTEADAAQFRPTAKKIVVFPHGTPAVTPPAPSGPAPESAPLRVGFLASAHPPNIEAARFIAERLAPLFPETEFDIVGSVCTHIDCDPGPNVPLHNVVSPARKHALIAGWCLALNPLTLGGGASFKLADYLALGVPSLCTNVGARGTSIVDAGAGEVAELADFPAALARILQNTEHRAAMADAARELGQRLSWDIVGAEARLAIDALMSTSRHAAPAAQAHGTQAKRASPRDIAVWAGTLPQRSLPLIFGGDVRLGAIEADELQLVLPQGLSALRLSFRTPVPIEVALCRLRSPGAPQTFERLTPSSDGLVELALPADDAVLAHISASPHRLSLAGLVAITASPPWRMREAQLSLGKMHRAALAPGDLQPGQAPPPTRVFGETRANSLADALKRSGRAVPRALLRKSLASAAAKFLVVSADPDIPLVRARARALACAQDTSVLLANGHTALLIPSSGASRPIDAGLAQIMLSLPDRCAAVLLPDEDVDLGLSALAETLKIAVRSQHSELWAVAPMCPAWPGQLAAGRAVATQSDVQPHPEQVFGAEGEGG